ncbi:MAG: efflux RND transporter periplasmic adaptor subunit [Bacteroidaceae bacterium]|nr:efflux RND transporter periplasmic adaptor subunit [Bacteroidaceae bacterium]
MKNRYIQVSLFVLLSSMFAACQSKTEVQPAIQPMDTLVVKPAKAPENQQTLNYRSANKGRIESVREIPVFSRIAEQIVMFGIEKTGQLVTKGQVLARLSDAALRERILHSRAKLEKAEFQYQAILMGQGYKRDHLDDATEDLKNLARINSGYNEAIAELHELEHELSYCTITAPISGAVIKIQNTLYGAALPGEALFYIVDTEHLKVGFDVLENELAKYQMGTEVSVTTLAFPSEQHKATISAISPVIDVNGMVHIEATMEPHPHLMPGMTAFTTITTP